MGKGFKMNKYIFGVIGLFLLYFSVSYFFFKANLYLSLGIAGFIAFFNYQGIKKHAGTVEAIYNLKLKRKKKG